MRVIQPVAASAARGLVADVYAEIRRDFGALVEPFTLFSPAPRLLASAWAACRESLVVGRVPRAHKEAVATAVSRANRCPYCVDAHAVMLAASGDAATGALLVAARDDEISDPALRALVAWTEATTARAHPALATPPFAARDTPEILGTAVFFHFVNRMVTALLGESPLPSRTILPGLWRRLAGRFFARALRREKGARSAIPALDDAPLPADLAWSAPAPPIARAFAQLAAVVEDAAAAALPAPERARIRDHLDAWDGAPAPLSRRWVEPIVGELAGPERTAATLALLAARSPHQIDESLLRAVRDAPGADERVVAALAWGAFEAARRIGAWSAPGPR